MTRRIEQPAFSNQGQNGRMILHNLDMGDRCDGLLLTLGGTAFTTAHITEILVKLGSTEIVKCTGAHLRDINEYMGRNVPATQLPIWFANPNAESIIGYEQGAIETDKGYSGFSIEVTVAGATAPELTCKMIKGESPKLNRAHANVFRGLKSDSVPLQVVGSNKITPPLGLADALIDRVHWFHSNVTHLTVKKDSVELLSKSDLNEVAYLGGELNRVAQAGHMCWDNTALNFMSDQVDQVVRNEAGQVVKVAPMQFTLDTSDTDTVTQYGELIGDIKSF